MSAAASQTGLGSSKEPEPCGLGPTGAIPRAFTPGPWDFASGVNEYGREGGPILGTVTKGGTWHIAVLPSDLGPESEANARLIAAAPELYEAAQTAFKTLEGHGDEALESGCPTCAAITQLRAALAKAKGQ